MNPFRLLIIFFLALTLRGSVSSVCAQSTENDPIENLTKLPFVQNTMRANDKNRDGAITKNEAINQLKQNFDRVDSNQDDKVTVDELGALAQRMRNRQQNRNPRPAATKEKEASKPPAVPESVIFQTDLAYREGNKKWKLDIAIPKNASPNPQPAIVFIHGGGWRSGDKSYGQWRSLPLDYASRGYVCISINYRLTDEATVLDCIADCKCAVRWLRANAEKYNVDPERIGAYGNSAGAHLVSMLGLASTEANLEGDGPFQDQSSLVQAVCCSAPPTDFQNWGKNQSRNIDAALVRLFRDLDVDKAKQQASPVTHVNEQAPPFLIIHGTEDQTVPIGQGDALYEELNKAGAKEVTFLRIEGAGHSVFKQHIDRTMPEMNEFFDRTLQRTDAANRQ